MKNKLADLNDHLFTQLERLNDEDLTPDQLQQETKRAHAVANVGKQIIANGNLVLRARMAMDERLITRMPKLIEHDSDE